MFEVIAFLPARRYASVSDVGVFVVGGNYASAGNSDRNVSVCPSRAGIVSKRRKLAA